jgi:hypothetical protein
MFFVWGKKYVSRKMGFVADFCPLCRKVRSFQLDRVGLASHVYYVSLGKGKLVGYAKKCMDCTTILTGNPDLYREVSKKLIEPGELQRSTFPNLQTHYAERLTLEQTITHSPASVPGDTRRALLKEPFILLNPAVEKRFSSTQIDIQTGLTLLAVLVFVPFLSSLGNQFAPAHGGEILLGLLLAGVGAVAVQGFRQTGRYFDTKIFPVLVPALKPLRPTTEEITSVITELKKAELKFGKKLKQSALLEHLKR